MIMPQPEFGLGRDSQNSKLIDYFVFFFSVTSVLIS
jgi:hypothetical protein